MSVGKVRTKFPVTIEPISNLKATVYITTLTIEYDPTKGYSALVQYATEENEVSHIFKVVRVEYTLEEAAQMEAYLNVNGDTVTEKLNDIIPKLTLFQAGISGCSVLPLTILS